MIATNGELLTEYIKKKRTKGSEMETRVDITKKIHVFPNDLLERMESNREQRHTMFL